MAKTARLAKADAAQRARVKRCSCGFGWRIRHFEYGTGGCKSYETQLGRVRAWEASHGAEGGPNPYSWKAGYFSP